MENRDNIINNDAEIDTAENVAVVPDVEVVDKLKSTKPMWRDILEIIITAFLIYGILSVFFVFSTVNQSSMYPTFEDGNFIVATRSFLSGNTFERGDIVLFKSDDGRVFIKRVIALPGDRLDVQEGKVYINNKEFDEDYIDDDVLTTPSMSTTIHEDCYFVMGDNRYNSIDSRDFGEVDASRIIGRVRMRIFPNTKVF